MNPVYFCETLEGEEAHLELEARAKWPCRGGPGGPFGPGLQLQVGPDCDFTSRKILVNVIQFKEIIMVI